MTDDLNKKLELPKDRATINSWCRNFVTTNPIVSTTVNFYSEIPLKYLTIDTSKLPKNVSSIFDAQIENLQIKNFSEQILKEYWTLGEAVAYHQLNETSGFWDKLIIQNPDYIIIKAPIAGEREYFLRPDENLRRLVLSNDKTDKDIQCLENISDKVIEHIKNGENIKLNNFYISYFARFLNPYDIRGASFMVSSFTTLMRYDKVNLQDKNLEALIKQNLLYPYDIEPNNKKMMTNAIRQRILFTAAMMRDWMCKKIFAPISELNDFYDYDADGEKTIIIPSVEIDMKTLKSDF